MLKEYVLPALILVAGSIACLCLATGGCGGTGRRSCLPVVDTAAHTHPRIDLGPDATVVGRLEDPAVVNATIYRADGEGGEKAEVGLAPGTWLVPGSVFVEPGPADSAGR